MFDILIKNGMVIDGSGSPARRADVGITGERIAALELLPDSPAAQVIDASGLVVAPGFIDIHSHADYILPGLPTADSKVHQGVTTEVVGNCGISAAPLNDEMRQRGDANSPLGSFGAKWQWNTFEQFLAFLQRQGTSVNVAPLVGHGSVRKKVMGLGSESPTPDQLNEMKNEVELAMQAGAFGLSTGLIYPPNVYSTTPEIIELARVASRHHGIYTSHIRGEGKTVLDAVEEAMRVGREAQLPVEISHLKAELRVNWHKMEMILETIHAARHAGQDVSADMYPYNAFCTTMTSMLPDWALAGGVEAMIERLQQPASRSRIRAALAADAVDGEPGYWEGTIVSSCRPLPHYAGRTLREISNEKGLAPEDTVMELLVEAGGEAEIVQFAMDEVNVEIGLATDFIMVGSDGDGRAAQGPYSAGKPHPRNYGTFPRVLGHYARERRLFPLETAVAKMTGMPAARLGLRDRGLLKPGFFADITVFDPDTVRDTATFANPHQYAAGIEYVLVNGNPVLWQGSHTRALPGKVLRRQ